MLSRIVLAFFTSGWAAVAIADETYDANKILNGGTILSTTIYEETPYTAGDVSIWWVGYEGQIYQCFADRFSMQCVKLANNDNFFMNFLPD